MHPYVDIIEYESRAPFWVKPQAGRSPHTIDPIVVASVRRLHEMIAAAGMEDRIELMEDGGLNAGNVGEFIAAGMTVGEFSSPLLKGPNGKLVPGTGEIRAAVKHLRAVMDEASARYRERERTQALEEPPMRTLGIAIIGYGGVGRLHALAYRAIPFHYGLPSDIARIVGVSRRRPAKPPSRPRARPAARSGRPTTATCSPATTSTSSTSACRTSLHAEVIAAAAAAGKHIYCEKPLAMTSPRAARSCAPSTQAGVKAQLGFNFRFFPAITRARQLRLRGLSRAGVFIPRVLLPLELHQPRQAALLAPAQGMRRRAARCSTLDRMCSTCSTTCSATSTRCWRRWRR